jgi:hypothetical protein
VPSTYSAASLSRSCGWSYLTCGHPTDSFSGARVRGGSVLSCRAVAADAKRV